MVCIFCGHRLDVINSRPQRRSNQVWRRRQCGECEALLTTIETVDLSKSLRLQRSAKHLEPFQRDILYISVYESCKHRGNAARDATGLTDSIINQVLRKKRGAIVTREQLCKITAEVLRRFDKAAAVQYAAYHPLSA